MKHLRPAIINKHTRFGKLIRILAVSFVAVFLLEIWMVNRLTTYGDRIQQIKDIRASFNLENQYLESLVAEKSSLLVIEEKALSLGFNPIKNIAYLQITTLAAAR